MIRAPHLPYQAVQFSARAAQFKAAIRVNDMEMAAQVYESLQEMLTSQFIAVTRIIAEGEIKP